MIVLKNGKQIDTDLKTWETACSVARMPNVYMERHMIESLERVDFMAANEVKELLKKHREDMQP